MTRKQTIETLARIDELERLKEDIHNLEGRDIWWVYDATQIVINKIDERIKELK